MSGRSTAFDKHIYKVKNLWTGRMEGKTSVRPKAGRRLTVPAQDVVAYRLIRQK